MTNYELIEQLKSLRTINPEKEWVDLAYSKLLSNISDEESPKSLFAGLRNIAKASFESRLAYSAVAVFVLVFGVFSVTYTKEAFNSIDAISANLYFGGPQSEKVRIFVEDSESVVDKEVAYEVKKIADEAGASFSDAINVDTDINNNADQDSGPSSDTTEVAADSASYTVVFKENSDSRDRFKRIIKDTIEVKTYNISQSLKDKDEEVSRQIEAILDDAREAYADGELIESLELVNAAEKSLLSLESK